MKNAFITLAISVDILLLFTGVKRLRTCTKTTFKTEKTKLLFIICNTNLLLNKQSKSQWRACLLFEILTQTE